MAREFRRRSDDPEDADFKPERSNDGLKIPVAISGISLLILVFGGGGLYYKVYDQAETILELKADIRENVKSQVSGERIARCEAGIEQLKASLRDEIVDRKEADSALWRSRSRREDGV